MSSKAMNRTYRWNRPHRLCQTRMMKMTMQMMMSMLLMWTLSCANLLNVLIYAENLRLHFQSRADQRTDHDYSIAIYFSFSVRSSHGLLYLWTDRALPLKTIPLRWRYFVMTFYAPSADGVSRTIRTMRPHSYRPPMNHWPSFVWHCVELKRQSYSIDSNVSCPLPNLA